MNFKKIKTQMDFKTIQALASLLEVIIGGTISTDDDKLLVAVLAEIKLMLELKILKMQDRYKLTFTPAQAIALRIMANDYNIERTSFLGNKLHQLSTIIHQTYQS